MGILESDIHSQGTTAVRHHKLSTNEIHKKLSIPGYNIILPQSWTKYGQARILLYVRQGVNYKVHNLEQQDQDLPSITVELGLKKEKKNNIQHILQRIYWNFIWGQQPSSTKRKIVKTSQPLEVHI